MRRLVYLFCILFFLQASISHSAQSNDHLGERAQGFGQSLKYISQYALLAAQKNSKIIALSASTLGIFYFLSTLDGCFAEQINISGTCPQSLDLQDLLGKALVGCNGNAMKIQWWNAHTHDYSEDLWGNTPEELSEYISKTNQTWPNKITIVDDYVKTAFDSLGNFFCSCLYSLEANNSAGTNFVFSLALPFVANTHGLGLNSDGTLLERFLGQEFSGGPDNALRCPAKVQGECQL